MLQTSTPMVQAATPYARAEPLPVLFVAFQSGRLANGGIQSLSEILGRLRRVRPILVTQLESSTTERWRAQGHEVHVWPLPWPRSERFLAARSSQRLVADLGALAAGNLRMLQLIRKHGIRVVHCNDGWASLLSTPSAQAAGARVVLNIRDTLLVGRQRWSLLRACADRVVVLSEEMRAAVEEMLALPAWAPAWAHTPISAVYSIVDIERMRPASPERREQLRRELGIAGPPEVSVGVIGALVRKKQQLELIRYLAGHPGALPVGVRLYFVGDFSPATDAYCRSCETAARESGLGDRIRFVGYTAQIDRWYQALDLTVMVSQFEGLARAMIESIACGTPMLAFDFCSAREILERHECGAVVPQGDFAALLTQLQRFASDADARRALGERGPALARQLFAPERVVASYEDVYLELGRGSARALSGDR